MRVSEMSYGEIRRWTSRIEELEKAGLTKKAWCDVGHELMEKHGLTEAVAVRLLHGRIDEAIALQEREGTDDQ